MKTVLPQDFGINPEMRAWAEKKVPQVDIEAQTEVFCDYWRGHGKMMADWIATWRNWMRRAPQYTRAMPQERWKPDGLH